METGGLGFGDMLRLLGQAGQIREKMGQMQERVARRTVEGAAGGGLVKVTANGAGEVLAVTFDPEALKDPDSLGPLVAAAVNAAQAKAKEVMAEELRGTLGQFNLPPGLIN